MASSAEDMITVKLRSPNGEVKTCVMSQDLVQMLKAPDCDLELRSAVLKEVFDADGDDKVPTPEFVSPGTPASRCVSPAPQCVSPTAQCISPVPQCVSPAPECDKAAPECDNPASECDNPADNQIPYSNSISKVKVWSEKEEKALIEVRSSMEDEFMGHKCHDSLWIKVQEKLKELKIHFSVAQIINKWKNMKKRYKEIIDSNSKTGRGSTAWKYFEAFNELYGNKASTHIEASFDSGASNPEILGKGGLEKDTATQKKIPKKRKSHELHDVIRSIEEKADKSMEEMKQHHDKQLQRMDRFLDLYEKSIQSRSKSD